MVAGSAERAERGNVNPFPTRGRSGRKSGLLVTCSDPSEGKAGSTQTRCFLDLAMGGKTTLKSSKSNGSTA